MVLKLSQGTGMLGLNSTMLGVSIMLFSAKSPFHFLATSAMPRRWPARNGTVAGHESQCAHSSRMVVTLISSIAAMTEVCCKVMDARSRASIMRLWPEHTRQTSLDG